jgi:type II secretory pathway predicted ATPase ExeA
MRSPYVATPSHDEAVARLAFAIERHQRFVCLLAEAGMGKSMVARRAVQEVRRPRRRAILVRAAADPGLLLGRIAEGLGMPSAVGSDRTRAWRSTARAIGAAAIEGCHVVLVVDGWDHAGDPRTMQDLTAVMQATGPGGAACTLVRIGRGTGDEPELGCEPWSMMIRLERLTRSEAESYLDAKLATAGCRDRLFTRRAIDRLHVWSEGVPRALDELASVALVAGAIQRLEVVTPEIVDGVALDGRLDVAAAAS